jgi:hypothetical protein
VEQFNGASSGQIACLVKECLLEQIVDMGMCFSLCHDCNFWVLLPQEVIRRNNGIRERRHSESNAYCCCFCPYKYAIDDALHGNNRDQSQFQIAIFGGHKMQ